MKFHSAPTPLLGLVLEYEGRDQLCEALGACEKGRVQEEAQYLMFTTI